MTESINGRRPKPEDISTLVRSINTLVERGDVRSDAKNLIKVLETDNTWGLPKGDVDTSLKVLKSFVNRPFLFREDVQELSSAFIGEKKHAVVEWDKIRADIGRRTQKLKGWATLAATAAIVYLASGPAADLYYQQFLSPEAVAAQQEAATRNSQIALQQQEAKKAEEEKQRKAKIDTDERQTLGITPSYISDSGFRIRYNPLDKNIKYTEVGGEKGYFNISSGYTLKWDQLTEKGDTERIEPKFSLDTYTRTKDGKKLPKLIRILNSSYSESYYLKDQSEEIDSSVVVFENVKTGKEYYLSFNRPENISYYQIALMKKELVASK